MTAASTTHIEGVCHCMRLCDYDRPKIPPVVTTEELRRGLSRVISHAAFGTEPVHITLRGRKVAAIISLDDLCLLLRMKEMRDAIVNAADEEERTKIYEDTARRLETEIRFS
jgi:prevent-host-death family protein